MLSVNYSKTAKIDLEKILTSLQEQYSTKLKDDFLKKLDKSMLSIQSFPEGFPLTDNQINVRKCVLTKQTSIIYRPNSEMIQVLAFFDTRQNPLKINKI